VKIFISYTTLLVTLGIIGTPSPYR